MPRILLREGLNYYSAFINRRVITGLNRYESIQVSSSGESDSVVVGTPNETLLNTSARFDVPLVFISINKNNKAAVNSL